MSKTTDPSENASVENLRPKSVPDQLVALGVVSHVSDIQVRLQITGGIVCLVDRYSISQAYTKILKEYEADYKIGKQPLVEPPKLGDLFKKGEQYVCKIVERQTRKGYAQAQDIIATLDPVQIQEDNIPGPLLVIPSVPLQGAIQSVEDHGYCVDLGFKNISGFLRFDECENVSNEDSKYHVGQIIRCFSRETLEPGNESRLVQLSCSKAALKDSKFSKAKCKQHALSVKSILPGSTGYLTVMKVQKNGLIVNFLDEFAGFVGLSHLEEDWQSPEKGYKISDTRKCTVLYYNPDSNTFALSLKPHKVTKKTMKHFLDDYYVGKIIKDAKVVFSNGLKTVHFSVGKFKALANVRDALNEDVATLTRDELHIALDTAYPDGSKHKCRIKSINYPDLTLVLSLRQDFLELSCVSVDELEPSDYLEVQVKKHVRDGIVVSFGLNLRAIILNCHLKDYISPKSHARYPVGMPLKCRVLKIDPDKYPSRVYMTNKEQLLDQELTIIDAYDKTFLGETVSAIIVKLKTNGLIVELFNNVKGFIPQRFCSDSKVRSVSDLFEVGQVVTCTVYRVEPDRQTLSLSIVPYERVVAMMKEKRKNKQEKSKQKELNKIDRKIERNSTATKAKTVNTAKAKALPLPSRKRKNSDDSETPETPANGKIGTKLKELNHGESGTIERALKKARRAASENTPAPQHEEDEVENESDEDESAAEDGQTSFVDEQQAKKQKSRLERSKEAKQREEKIRQVERELLDPNRPAQSIGDYERLVLKTPNSADVWINYSKFFLDNVETEKARVVCRRALDTINFRLEKEKLKVWMHMISIEAKFGGSEKLRQMIEEAAQTNDKLELFRRASKVLISCGELDEAERMYDQLLDKLGGKRKPDIWIDYVIFLMDQRKDLDKARSQYEKAVRTLEQLKQHTDAVYFRSRFAHLEFKHGDVERGKTLFENLLSENPKRMDLWSVYQAAIRKFGTRQLDTNEVRQHNEQILERIASLQK